MAESHLVKVWRQHLAAATAGLHLVDAGHPLQMFVGKTELSAPRMVIRTASKPRYPALSDLVLVDRYEDQSGKWSLSFTLQNLKFSEVFLRLVDDVHARSAAALDEAQALDRVSSVLDEWRRLLKPRSTGLLTMEELRGLVGELWLVNSKFAESRALEKALDGWLGPMGLPQDFWYPEDGYFEAKSVGPGSTAVRISSEFQLDADGVTLVVMLVANANEQTAGSVNLPILIDRILAGLSGLGADPASLTSRLERLGVDRSEAFYRDTWFLVANIAWYDADPSFPAIRASDLPPGIGRVAFQIDLASIEQFKVASEEVG